MWSILYFSMKQTFMNLMHACSHKRPTKHFLVEIFLDNFVIFFLLSDEITRQIHYEDLFINVSKEYEMTSSFLLMLRVMFFEENFSFLFIPIGFAMPSQYLPSPP